MERLGIMFKSENHLYFQGEEVNIFKAYLRVVFFFYIIIIIIFFLQLWYEIILGHPLCQKADTPCGLKLSEFDCMNVKSLVIIL